MPVSRRRIKKRAGPGHKKMLPQNFSPVLHYAQAAERNFAAFVQEFKRAVKTRQHLPELKESMLVSVRIGDGYGDLTDFMETSPEAAWLRGEEL